MGNIYEEYNEALKLELEILQKLADTLIKLAGDLKEVHERIKK